VNQLKNTWFVLRLAVRIAMGTTFESAGIEQLNINSLAFVGAESTEDKFITQAKLPQFSV